MKKIFIFVMLTLALSACSSVKNDIVGEWRLVSYGDAANPTPAIEGVDTSIQFDANGEMSGNAGCNGFGGKYELDRDTITFSEIMSTMMFCEETSAQEQGVLSLFADNVGLQIQVNSDTLTITSADGLSVANLARK